MLSKHMKSIQTIDKRPYVATVTGETTVSDKASGLVLAKTNGPGQVTFFAIGEETVLSDDRAVVMPASFKGAPAGSCAVGGVSEDRVDDLLDAALVQTTVMPLVETGYEWKAPIRWAQIDGSILGSGVVSRVEILCLNRENEELSTGELFLALYEADDSGNFRLLAVSRNAVRQQVGKMSTWEFDDVALHGRHVRLCPTLDAAGGWDDTLVLGAGGRPRFAHEDSFVELSTGVRSAVMLSVKFSAVTRVGKFAPAGHAADQAVHVTEEERDVWNASAVEGKMPGHVSVCASEGELSSLNVSNAANSLVQVQRQVEGSIRNYMSLTVDEEKTELSMHGPATRFDLSNKATPAGTPTARCCITATSASASIQLQNMPVMTDRTVFADEEFVTAAGVKAMLSTLDNGSDMVTQEERSLWNETASYFTKETQTGNISQTVAETLTLTVRSNYWGQEPFVRVQWDSAGTAEYGSEYLAFKPNQGAKFRIALQTLITHPGNGESHLNASERAGLIELLEYKDALLALLDPSA